MTISNANRTSANATTEGNLKKDVSGELWHLGEPSAFPLMTLVGGELYTEGKTDPQKVAGKVKKEVADVPKYSVIEKNPLDRAGVAASAVADTTTTTVVTDDNTIFRINDTIKNNNTGEFMLVTAVDSGGANLTCRRNVGSTSFQIAANDVLKVVGNAFAEGAAKATLVSQLAAERERRLQIFKRSFGVTGTLMQSLLYAGKGGKGANSAAWDEEMTQGAVNHKLDIENSFWYNPGADSSTNASNATVNLTRGVIAEIGSTRTYKCGGSLDVDQFFGELSQECFKYGPRRKTLFADAKLRSLIDKFGRDKIQVKNMDTEFGLNVSVVESMNGVFEVVSCGTFAEYQPTDKTGYGVVLDLERVIYKHLSERDNHYEVDIQTPGTDAKEGQFLTECGLSLRSLDHHHIIQVYAD